MKPETIPCKCGFGNALKNYPYFCLICAVPKNAIKCITCKENRASEKHNPCMLCYMKKVKGLQRRIVLYHGDCGFCGRSITKHDSDQKEKHLRKLSEQIRESMK